MARRSAWPGLQGLLADIGALDPLQALARQSQAPVERMAIAVAAFAKALSQVSDQGCRVQPLTEGVELATRPCPHCWGRQTSEPICHAMVGALEGLCSLVAGEMTWSITESACCAAGSEDCRFFIQPVPAG
jgi:predicted hydrocarbon binding protein